MRGRRTAVQAQTVAVRDLEVLRRYEAGETLASIGAAIGLTRERIRQLVKASGVAMPWDYKCAVKDCQASPRTPHAYCQAHRRRFERYGDPLGTKPLQKMSTARRPAIRTEDVVARSAAGLKQT